MTQVKENFRKKQKETKTKMNFTTYEKRKKKIFTGFHMTGI